MDDNDEYNYVTTEEFENLSNSERLIIKTQYRKNYYGISKEAVLNVISKKKIPVLVITPSACSDYEKKENKTSFFLSCFIDVDDMELDKRLKKRDGKVTDDDKKWRSNDRAYKDDCLYCIKNISTDMTAIILKKFMGISFLWGDFIKTFNSVNG